VYDWKVVTRPKSLSARQIQAISRAVADPTRYGILKQIAEDGLSACSDLRTCFSVTPATLSHHIRELEAALLVETSKRGKYVDVHFCREIWIAYLAALTKL
jgi:ArsR family transcriptional regulator